jgi:hypothetical protein
MRGLLIAAMLAAAVPARGQSNVGAGPLTMVLPDVEPAASVLSWGPVRLAPGVQVPEIGYDSNVFYEAVDPKEDWMVSVMPDVLAYSRLRLLRISAYAGVNMTYYGTYASERSVSDQYRGRVDVLLSRIRPFVGGGYVTERTKPNGEINVRADRLDTELSGGVAFDWSPSSRVYGAAARLTTEYQSTDQYEGVPLDQALNRDNYGYSAGFQTALTPLTSLTLKGSLSQDRFRESPERDADNGEVTAEFVFSPQAVLRGTARVGFKDFRSNDPTVDPYTGVVLGAGLVVPIMDMARVDIGVLRDTQYSFEEEEAYYVENTFDLTYTHLIFGNFDVQGRGAWSGFTYGNREGQSARRDTLTTWLVGVGYNLQNRTRLSVQFEDAERRSPELADRNYSRRRLFFSWSYRL